ncbi:MAG TPA: hypothetical protein VIX62_06425, partial [Actinomycetota bacterium]
QGLLGGIETLVAGVTALAAGALYEEFDRTVAYTACAIAMVTCVLVAYALVGPEWRRRPATVEMVSAGSRH